MDEQFIAELEKMEGDIEKYADEYLKNMEGFELTSDTILRIVKLTKNLCDLIEAKLKSQNGEG